MFVSYYIFGGIVGALRGSTDGVRGHAPLLLLTNHCFSGALSGTLFTDGVLEARDGHIICTINKDKQMLLIKVRHT